MCSVAQLSLTLCSPMGTVADQASLSMEFCRQEYLSGVPFPPPGDLPNPEIELISVQSPALAGGFFTTSATWARSQKILNVFCSAANLPRCAIHPFPEAKAGPQLPIS